MKKLAAFSFVFCFFIMRLFPQSNYTIISNGLDKVLRNWGAILRFDVRDKQTMMPLQDASIEIHGDNNREIAVIHTNQSGVGILITRDIESLPHTINILVTYGNHNFYQQTITRTDLKSEKNNNMIILHNSNNNWNGAPSPSDQEIVQAINAQNYQVFNTGMNINYSGPGIFEYSVLLEQIKKTSGQINSGQGEEPNGKEETYVSSNSKSSGNNYSTSTSTIWVSCPSCFNGHCPKCHGKGTVHIKTLKGEECPSCHGKGYYISYMSKAICTLCYGSGKVERINGRYFASKPEESDVPCPKCLGDVNWSCSRCNGDCYILVHKEGGWSVDDIKAWQDQKGNWILPKDMHKYYYDERKGQFILKSQVSQNNNKQDQTKGGQNGSEYDSDDIVSSKMTNPFVNTVWKRTRSVQNKDGSFNTDICYIKFIDSQNYIFTIGDNINNWNDAKLDWSIKEGVIYLEFGDECKIENDKYCGGGNSKGGMVKLLKIK